MKTFIYKELKRNILFRCVGLLLLFAGIASAQTITPINQIQGEGNLSSFAGKQVTTRGIVTAIVKKGFYIQTPDAETDQNPKTSEGIYVFANDDMPSG